MNSSERELALEFNSTGLYYIAYLESHEYQLKPTQQMSTYFLVHSLAVASYRVRSVLYKWAISGTRGSSGLGSVNIEQIDNKTG